MKINVLYGEEGGNNFSSELRYIEEHLGTRTSEVWDGKADFMFGETDGSIKEELLSLFNGDEISFEPEERFLHSMGKSSPEILMARDGRLGRIVDAVLYPTYENAPHMMKKLLDHGYRASIYGGGTSVSGSLLITGDGKVVSLDTRNFKRSDIHENYATLGAGLTGREAEEILNRHGYTIGNFPESFNESTLGGWVATKAVGQESNQYGGIEDIVTGATLVRSSGELADNTVPRRSEGLGVKDMALGSDGRFGLVTDVTMRIFRMPRKRYYHSRMFNTFEDGIRALSSWPRIPTVARLSDEVETEFALKSAGDSASVRYFRKYLELRGFRPGALLIIVNNDHQTSVNLPGSIGTGASPAKSWIKGRYGRPGIARALWKNGLVPDTLETSTTWDRMANLYHEVKNEFYGLRQQLDFKGEIMAHISHSYPDGGCIYFTTIIQHDEAFETLSRVRDAMIRAFISNGGAVTHHHGYGKLFSPYISEGVREMQRRLSDPLLEEE